MLQKQFRNWNLESSMKAKRKIFNLEASES